MYTNFYLCTFYQRARYISIYIISIWRNHYFFQRQRNKIFRWNRQNSEQHWSSSFFLSVLLLCLLLVLEDFSIWLLLPAEFDVFIHPPCPSSSVWAEIQTHLLSWISLAEEKSSLNAFVHLDPALSIIMTLHIAHLHCS